MTTTTIINESTSTSTSNGVVPWEPDEDEDGSSSKSKSKSKSKSSEDWKDAECNTLVKKKCESKKLKRKCYWDESAGICSKTSELDCTAFQNKKDCKKWKYTCSWRKEEGCLNNSNILVTRALARRSMRKVNDAEFQPPNSINSNSSILAVSKILGLA